MDPFTFFRKEVFEYWLGIDNPIFSNLLTAFTFIVIILFIIYTIKLQREVNELGRKSKERMRKIEKMWLEMAAKDNKRKNN